jgi:predicted ATPase
VVRIAQRDEANMWDPVAGNSNLPTSTTRIVGRGQIIELILQDARGARLLSVVGAGGIGKTTVALAVAELVVESFKNGVWLVDFAPLKDASLVPSAIAASTGLVVHGADTLSALCKFLRERETLLVLDNCEHVLGAIAPCVARILAEAPGVHVLTTSRAPLGLPEERIHRLPGLEVPPESASLTASDAMKFAAIDLFVERAGDRLEGFALNDEDAPVVADICRALDGIALAIELAAMRIDVFGVQGLHKQLDDRFRLLQGRRGGLERHRTLAATLDWSFSLLPAREADLLCAVAVFAGAFRKGDAAAISQLPAAETAASLAELAAQSLLTTDSDAGEASYRPLETTRAYCLEKLVSSGQSEAVRSRHAEYVCSVIQRAAGELAARPAAEWGVEYRRYLDDMRDALAWAGAEPTRRELLIQLTAAGTVLWNHFSLTSESRPHLQRATQELQETSLAGTAVEMNLQLALSGATLYTRGTAPEGRAAVGRALEIALERQDTGYHLVCLRIIAAYELFGGQNDAGLRTLQDFVARAAVVDPSALPEGETHLGCVEIFVGQLVPARQRLERLYAGLEAVDDGNSLRFLYNNSITILFVLSHAEWLTGSPGAAERHAATAVDYARQANHELTLSNALAWAALVSYWAGRVEECRRHSSTLSDLVGKHGIVTWGPVATFCQGALAALDDETRAEGIEVLERTVTECRAIGHLARFPYYMGVLGEALARANRLPEAEARIDEALEVATQANDNWSFPELLRIRALVLAAQGRVSEQESTLLESLALAERYGAACWRLRTAIDLARLWQTRARTAEAARLLRSTLDTFTDGLDTHDVATATELLRALE